MGNASTCDALCAQCICQFVVVHVKYSELCMEKNYDIVFTLDVDEIRHKTVMMVVKYL